MIRAALRRHASVAVGALVLFGCAKQVAEVPSGKPTGESPPTTPRGQMVARPGRPGLVIAAPHGASDASTGEIATEVARRTGWGLVVATGFGLEPDAPGRPGRRYHVNRPFEGVPSGPATEDRSSDSARLVYQTFERRVRETAQGPLRFYAEIHGNDRRESAGRIEIATVGIDREYAQRLRALCELVRDAHLRGRGVPGPKLDILVEPADALYYSASAAKRDGILKLAERALHIELPKTARVEFRELYTAILADFVAQAVTVPRGR